MEKFILLLLFSFSGLKAQDSTIYLKYAVDRHDFSNGSTEYNVNFENGIQLKGMTEKFDTSTCKLTFYESEDKPMLINGNKIFGSDIDIPKNKLTSLVFTADGIDIKLDVSHMYNVWFWSQREYQSDNLHLKKVDNNWELIGVFSDASGSYIVKWIMSDSKQRRSIISNDEGDIINLFYGGKW